jgi:hypothetical protein
MQAVLESEHERRGAPLDARGRERPLVHDRDTRFDIWAQYLAMIVGAEVVVEVEALDSDQPVKLDPLSEVSSVVVVGSANCEVAAEH